MGAYPLWDHLVHALCGAEGAAARDARRHRLGAPARARSCSSPCSRSQPLRGKTWTPGCGNGAERGLDATALAACGLHRRGLDNEVGHRVEPGDRLPRPGRCRAPGTLRGGAGRRSRGSRRDEAPGRGRARLRRGDRRRLPGARRRLHDGSDTLARSGRRRGRALAPERRTRRGPVRARPRAARWRPGSLSPAERPAGRNEQLAEKLRRVTAQRSRTSRSSCSSRSATTRSTWAGYDWLLLTSMTAARELRRRGQGRPRGGRDRPDDGRRMGEVDSSPACRPRRACPPSCPGPPAGSSSPAQRKPAACSSTSWTRLRCRSTGRATPRPSGPRASDLVVLASVRGRARLCGHSDCQAPAGHDRARDDMGGSGAGSSVVSEAADPSWRTRRKRCSSACASTSRPCGTASSPSSDFGLQDDFVGVCHGVIRRIAPDAQIVDITHGIPPARCSRACSVLAQHGAVHARGRSSGRGRPGVGGIRRPVASRTGWTHFRGPGQRPSGAQRGRSGRRGAGPRAREPGEHAAVRRARFTAATSRRAYLALGVPLASSARLIDPDTLVRPDLPEPDADDSRIPAPGARRRRLRNMQLNPTRSTLRPSASSGPRSSPASGPSATTRSRRGRSSDALGRATSPVPGCVSTGLRGRHQPRQRRRRSSMRPRGRGAAHQRRKNVISFELKTTEALRAARDAARAASARPVGAWCEGPLRRMFHSPSGPELGGSIDAGLRPPGAGLAELERGAVADPRPRYRHRACGSGRGATLAGRRRSGPLTSRPGDDRGGASPEASRPSSRAASRFEVVDAVAALRRILLSFDLVVLGEDDPLLRRSPALDRRTGRAMLPSGSPTRKADADLRTARASPLGSSSPSRLQSISPSLRSRAVRLSLPSSAIGSRSRNNDQQGVRGAVSLVRRRRPLLRRLLDPVEFL